MWKGRRGLLIGPGRVEVGGERDVAMKPYQYYYRRHRPSWWWCSRGLARPPSEVVAALVIAEKETQGKKGRIFIQRFGRTGSGQLNPVCYMIAAP